MSKCTVCGVNFVGTPECMPPSGECVRCENKRLKELEAENQELKAERNRVEYWKGVASAKFGDGRTVQEIEADCRKDEWVKCLEWYARVHMGIREETHIIATANAIKSGEVKPWEGK